jgi:hypothetical protein
MRKIRSVYGFARQQVGRHFMAFLNGGSTRPGDALMAALRHGGDAAGPPLLHDRPDSRRHALGCLVMSPGYASSGFVVSFLLSLACRLDLMACFFALPDLLLGFFFVSAIGLFPLYGQMRRIGALTPLIPICH